MPTLFARSTLATRVVVALTAALVLLAAFFYLGHVASARTDQPEAVSLTLLDANQAQVSLQITVPPLLPQPASAEAPYARLSVPGTNLEETPGQPMLPYTVTLIAVPPGATIEPEVTSANCQTLAGSWRLAPAAARYPVASNGGFLDAIQTGELHWESTATEDAAIYQLRTYYPANQVAVGKPQTMRGRQLVDVRIYPWQIVPATGEMRVCTHMEVTLHFSQPAAVETANQAAPDPWFEPVFAAHVANWDAARTWSTPRPQTPAASPAWQPAVRISLRESGLYRITPQMLTAAGVNVASVNPKTFRLSWRGQELAIEVVGEGDGRFQSADEIRFYAPPERSRYTLDSVFWLRWGSGNGVRMVRRSARPANSAANLTVYTRTLRLESQSEYRSEPNIATTEDHFFYPALHPTTSSPKVVAQYAFTPTALAAVPGATVTARLSGLTYQPGTPDHWARLWLNGRPVQEAGWEGPTVVTMTNNLAGSVFLASSNVLTLETNLARVPGLNQYWVYPDWFRIAYPATMQATNNRLDIERVVANNKALLARGFTSNRLAVYDVSNPRVPISLTNVSLTTQSGLTSARFQSSGSRYYLSTRAALRTPNQLALVNEPDLKSTALGADYIVMGPADFLAAAQPLLATRQAEGLRVQAVDVAHVYDQFTYGYPDPQAMRNFLAAAYTNWARPAPAFVLLLGDGHFDYRNDLGYNLRNPVRPYLAPIDWWIRETAADNMLVTFDGPGDVLPEMHIGRLPVNRVQEVLDVMQKMEAYAAVPLDQWPTESSYAADRQPDPGSFGDFHTYSDDFRYNWLTPDMTSEPVYVGTQPYAYPDGPAANTALLDAWGNGELFTQWLGHGSIYRWGYLSSDRVLSVVHRNNLPAQTKLPFVAELGCSTGYFIMAMPADSDSAHGLGETLVKTAGAGAIGDVSFTGLHTFSSAVAMGRGLHENLFVNQVTRPGVAVTGMKLYTYFNASSPSSIIHSTVLFGDPAMSLRLLTPNQAPSAAGAPAVGSVGSAVDHPTAVILTDVVAAAPAAPVESLVFILLVGITTLWVMRRRWRHRVWAAEPRAANRPDGPA